MKISELHSKSGSSNLLVDRTFTIVALSAFMLALVSSYCKKEELLSEQVHIDLGDCYEYFLWCSGESAFQ